MKRKIVEGLVMKYPAEKYLKTDIPYMREKFR
jgi:hypothetical protein